MHQSGQERAHSMQTVQFSSLSAMTPRARVGGSSRSWGYCTVTAGFSIVRNVTPSPLTNPGIFGLWIFFMPTPSSERDLQCTGYQDVEQADRDEELPGERLELILAQARVGEPGPEHQERHGHDLADEHDRPDHPLGADRQAEPAGKRPPAEEERRRDGCERE